MINEVILESTLTCPDCGHCKTGVMPSDACLWFYECQVWHTPLNPKPGDCCAFSSHGSVPCPPIQLHGKQTGCCGQS